MSSKSAAAAAGHSLWSKMPKVNAELFALTYGSLVGELLTTHHQDDHNVENIHAQLTTMGHSMGVRMMDEFLAKSTSGNVLQPCSNLNEACHTLAKSGCRMLLGVSCDVVVHDASSVSLLLFENPLALFVELPKEYSDQKLHYSQIYCGMIQGALEQVNYKVKAEFVQDQLLGDDVNEIKVTLKEVLVDGAGEEYQEE